MASQLTKLVLSVLKEVNMRYIGLRDQRLLVVAKQRL